jgi:hypothetical protein
MSHDSDSGSPQHDVRADEGLNDGRTLVAVSTGVAAALIAGGLWALLANTTGYEIGFVAWGIGAFVGVSMMRITRNRSKTLAATAAGLALTGLLVGKALMFMYSTGPLANELYNDDVYMAGYVAWRMYDSREFDEGTLEAVDVLGLGDTVPDSIWAGMTDQAGARLAGMSEAERQVIARGMAEEMVGDVGLIQGMGFHTSPYDLLWILLAVGSAYRFMLPARKDEPQDLQAV